MPRILLKKNAEIIKVYFWRNRSTITVGSSKKCNIFVNDKSSISEQHCLLKKDNDNRYFVLDNETMFGTRVNGMPVKDSEINFGDEIEIGNAGYSLTFLSDEISRSEFYLLGIYGKFFGKKYYLKDETYVGREYINPQGVANDIVLLEDMTVSKGHCKITLSKDYVYVTDIGSTGGTTVNGEKLQYLEKTRIHIGDEICIGRTIFRLWNKEKDNFSRPKKQKIFFLKLIQIFVMTLLFFILGYSGYNLFNSISTILIFSNKPRSADLRLSTKNFEGNIAYQSDVSTETYRYTSSLGVADLNKDGVNDVVYLDKSGYLFAWDGLRGTTLWKQQEVKVSNIGSVVIDDINDDGYPDIIFTTLDSLLLGYDGYSGKVIFKLNLQGNISHITPAVGDINLDGKKDIVLCNEEGVIFLIYSAGYFSSLEKVTLYSDSPVYASAVIISSSKMVPTVVICSYNGKITMVDGKSREITNLNLVSMTKKSHFITVAPGVGDVNKDGIPELVFATSLPNYVTLVDISLSKVLWSYFIQPQPQEEIKFFSSPIILDTNNDGDNEVIFCSPTGYVYCFKGMTDFFGGELLWSLQLNQQRQVNRIVSQPAVANIVKDKKPELVIGDEDGFVYIVGDDDNKGIIIASQKVEDVPITSAIILADIIGDGTLSILYTTLNNTIRVLTTSVKVLKRTIFSGMYLYTPSHVYINMEDVKPQIIKIFLNISFIIILILFSIIKILIKKTKTPKRKVI